MTMPNFLIIGAAKSGTTSLYLYLQQHPQIYMSPKKETNFFAYEGEQIDYQWSGIPSTPILESITDLASYQAQFQAVAEERAIGEASPFYLYNSRAPERIQHYLPDVKLIAILRHPIDRAFSQFVFLKQIGRELCPTFEEALQKEAARKATNWAWDYNYRDMGCYSVQLKRYLDRFTREQLKIFLYDDLRKDPPALLRQLFKFLDVDERFMPDTSLQHNSSHLPKENALGKFMARKSHPLKTVARILVPGKFRQRIANPLKARSVYRPHLAPETRQRLMETYREEILALQELIQRDLTEWLQ